MSNLDPGKYAASNENNVVFVGRDHNEVAGAAGVERAAPLADSTVERLGDYLSVIERAGYDVVDLDAPPMRW